MFFWINKRGTILFPVWQQLVHTHNSIEQNNELFGTLLGCCQFCFVCSCVFLLYHFEIFSWVQFSIQIKFHVEIWNPSNDIHRTCCCSEGNVELLKMYARKFTNDRRKKFWFENKIKENPCREWKGQYPIKKKKKVSFNPCSIPGFCLRSAHPLTIFVGFSFYCFFFSVTMCVFFPFNRKRNSESSDERILYIHCITCNFRGPLWKSANNFHLQRRVKKTNIQLYT